ncbi:MAG: xanthan lyase [Prevotellaceae bacterium]|nr:xanthan lyase [Prevotellaceae bacterium]MDY3856720.1 xanthan lyase [Bacteroidaceae bacterium]
MTHTIRLSIITLALLTSAVGLQAQETPDSLGKFKFKTKVPLTYNLSKPYHPTLGLANRHIALWPSHGLYFNQKEDRWKWQRARIFQTVEDIYTQSYVLPFLVPMLENAGANVLMPRERDINSVELLIDGDGSSAGCAYTETAGTASWQNGQDKGFAMPKGQLEGWDNPFKMGSYRQINSVKKAKDASQAVWTVNVPSAGNYGVYVSYKSLPQSAEDATYTICHHGQQTNIKVNQTMGGGTWIFLGTYSFAPGSGDKIVLTNVSRDKDRIITADAVKVGGGIGNVARKPLIDSLGIYSPHTSGYPRYKEGARYWMQWAGVPDSIYSPSEGTDDYRDDYLGRGHWVNWLAGGSTQCPNYGGLNIPVDLSFAFHSDAGNNLTDNIIGTLIICDYEKKYHNGGTYANGASRELAKYLCQDIQDQVTSDLRRAFEPKWTKRQLWNKPYSEALWPRVPAALLELLSHHNFADMRYGLDPRFRFAASRAIYKGMLKFICSQNGLKYVVEPLAPNHLALRWEPNGEVTLSWQAVSDSLEPSAEPEQYIVYRRVGQGDFDNGTLVKRKTQFRCTIPTGQVCSFKVTAVNKGGESFPSEILSVGKAEQERGRVLVVSGFDRVSGPADFKAPSPADTALAGFRDDIDHGVPYICETNYVGSMKEFRRSIKWTTDDSPGFGGSRSDHEKETIAGNTFDYPAVHGASILKAGWSFISVSNEAVEDSLVRMEDYPVVDWILGKQKQTKTGRGGIVPLQFKTFTDVAQRRITAYCKQGGRFLVSGAYVASDLWDNPDAVAQKSDQQWAKQVLHYTFLEPQAAKEGKVKTVPSPLLKGGAHYNYYNELNDKSYVVESPDGIMPVGDGAYTVMRYEENEISCGIAYRGDDYSTMVLGFPIESIKSSEQRDSLMSDALQVLSAPFKK